MCGICGVIDLRHDQAGAHLAPMSARLRHRGPDDEGLLLGDFRSGSWVNCAGMDTVAELGLAPVGRHMGEAYNIALGHRRLSILDTSPAGHGPMAYADGKVWLTYNGEVYNYLELRRDLEDKGYEFRTGTDTEVILAAYLAWGTGCLSRFNGMWAFALWDVSERRLLLARDRFGVKPLHYSWDGDRLLFASEIKALLAHPAVRTGPNEGILYDYLYHGAINHTEETFFEGILTLPPGNFLLLDLDAGTLRVEPWWDIRSVNTYLGERDQPPDDAAVSHFRDLLTDAVRLRLRSDVPVGSCLSGGIDSSSIVALANHLLIDENALPVGLVGAHQRTFSAVFDDPALDERSYLQPVLESTGAASHLVFPKGEGGLWDELETLQWHQEEPFASSSIYAQWNVMRLARQNGVTVLLDGQGADEVLGGYSHYMGPYLAQVLRQRGPVAFGRAARAAAATTRVRPAMLAALAATHLLPAGLHRAAAQLGAGLRTNPTVAAGMLNPDFYGRQHKARRAYGKTRPYPTLASQLVDAVRASNLNALLRYEDRNSMAFHIEARVPFLDYRLVQYVFAQPASARIHDGWTKWILRQSMAGRVPDTVRWRRGKLGFETPQKAWLAASPGRVAGYFAGEPRSAAYLSESALAKLRGFEQQPDVRLPGLWRMLNLEVWLKTMFA